MAPVNGGNGGGSGGRDLPPLPGKMPKATGGNRPAGRRLRATLTKEQAALIYTLRPPDKDDPNPNKMAGNSQLLSKRFGVSPKAVRDVWNRRTWAHATKDAPSSSPADLELLEHSMESEKSQAASTKTQHEQSLCNRAGINIRSPGRPVGSKDSKPRRRRSAMKVGYSGLLDNRSHCRCFIFSVSVCANLWR